MARSWRFTFSDVISRHLYIFFLVEFTICAIFVDNFCDNICFRLYKSPKKVAKCMFLKLMNRSVKARRSCYDVCNESCLLPCNVRNHVY